MSITNHKDWFEFILDLNLLERHLEQLNPDPSGCSLIIQFLYHANMTEQVYNSYQAVPSKTDQSETQTPQVELKSKRIKILRILALKTAAILEWNLFKFEKEIPIAVMSDLLHIFLRITMSDNNEPKYHSQLDLDKLENQTLFALQLLHRWCIRSVIFSKFPKKPPTKPVSINMPGVLNPLQHMRDANENILKAITNNVQESVDFLEKFIKQLNKSVYKPNSSCFTNINSENGSYELIWSNSNQMEIEEIKNYVCYDLGIYFFQHEQYDKCFNYFKLVKDFKIKNVSNQEFNSYTLDLDSYLVACKSLLNIDLDQTDNILNTQDQYTKQVITKMALIDNSIKNNFRGLFDYLLEDNKTCNLSISYRLNLEKIVLKTDLTLMDQIYSSNLVRLIAESIDYSNLNYETHDLKFLAQAINYSFENLPQTAKNNLVSFINLNYKKFNFTTRSELSKILNSLNIHSKDGSKNSSLNNSMETDQNMDNSTPSSPPPESSMNNSINLKDNSILNFAKLAIQTSDSVVLKNSINKFNYNYSQKHGLRFFWPKWQLNNILSIPISQTYLSNNLKLNHVNDMDFFFVSYSKIIQLIALKKFDSALKLYNSLDNFFGSNQKISKYLFNIYLYLTISKYFYNFDSSLNKEDLSTFYSKIEPNNKFSINQDQIIKNCKSYLNACKLEPELISPEIMLNVLSFLLTCGEFGLINSNELNIFIASQHQKKGLLPINSPVFVLFKISRQMSRLCLDVYKLDKNLVRKIARELWDSIIDLFTDQILQKRTENMPASLSSQSNVPYDASTGGFGQTGSTQTQVLIPRDQQMLFQSRELIRKLFLLIKNKQIRTLIISILSTIFNIADTQANNEIYNEFRYLWPSSLANSQTLNLTSLTDLLISLLNDSVYSLNQYNSSWLKTYADILYAKTNLCDSTKFFLKILILETKYFFKSNKINFAAAKLQKKDDDLSDKGYLDDKMIKLMIKSLIGLNKHTQAALLCQFLTSNDYSAAFRNLQESSVIAPSLDDMDQLYSSIWDIDLLEYLTSLNYQRGFNNKKNLCLKLISSQNMNKSNPSDINQKTIDAKKSNLFLNLLKYYFYY